MRRRRGMDDERFCVAHVRKLREELKRLDEATALLARTFEVEAEHCAAAARQKLLRQRMVRMFRQLRISDRAHQRMLAQKCDDLARVVDMLRHSKRQRFDALQELECGKGCHAGAEVAYAFATRAKQERRSRRFFDENHVVETAVRLCQRRELASN